MLKMLALILIFVSCRADTVRAQPVPADAVLIFLDVSNQGLARQLMPQSFTVQDHGVAKPVTLRDLAYCGTDENGNAAGIAIAEPASAAAGYRLFVGSNDCSATLQSVATRVAKESPSVPWRAAVKVSFSWKPWTLAMHATRVALGQAGTSGAPNASAFLNKGQALLKFSTKNFTFHVSGNHTATFSVSPKFEANQIVARIARSAVATFDNTAYDQLESTTAKLPSAGTTNAILVVSQSMLKDVVFATTALPITVYKDSGHDVTLEQLVTAGDANAFSIVGKVKDSKLNLGGVMQAVWKGDSLALDSIQSSPDQETCSEVNVLCQARNAALQGAATILDTLLKNKFGGTPMRPISQTDPVNFNVNGREASASIVVIKTHSTKSAYILQSNVLLENR